jgi:hypothetical protein
MKKRFGTAWALAAVAALLLSSCRRPGWGLLPGADERALRVVLPAAPPAWAALPGLRMTLHWRGPGGLPREASADPGSSIGIEVERGSPQAILALPEVGGEGLKPAGALYPEALAGGEGDELVLDWVGGYAASLWLALEKGGSDPAGFDLGALARAGAGRAGDPWLVAPLEAARRLAEGNFRIDLYRMPERFALELPGPGPWIPESPFAAAPEGAALAVGLPEGLWRFVGGGAELFASVDEEGRAVFAYR